MKALLIGLALLMVATSCAPGTEGIIITQAEPDNSTREIALKDGAIRLELPKIPIVRLPAISAAGEYDKLLAERLGSLSITPISGVEVVDVQCEDDGIIYQGDESSDVFQDVDLRNNETVDLKISPEGFAEYNSEYSNNKIRIRTAANGSGEYIQQSPTRLVSIYVDANGSGTYYNDNITETTTVAVAGDGSGEFYRKQLRALLTVKLKPDGAGELYSEDEDAEQIITVDARADGSGEMYYELADRTVTVLVRSDGSWELQDEDFDHWQSVTVNPDGTGQYKERGLGGSAMTLDFDAEGKTIGPDVILPPRPRFAVTDRFPQLGTLVSITPPCATVVRFDSEVFFEFNKAELLPQAQALIASIAPALIEANRAIEVNGHTDSTGTEEYNLDLSLRRAEAVAGFLRSLGVGVQLTVQGFGEAQPIAPNNHPDGTDDEVGQSRNRRVELVING